MNISFPPFTTAYGGTPIDADAREFLMPRFAGLQTNAELNSAESENIAQGWLWAFGQKWTPAQMLTQGAYRELHAEMFGDVWTWAGKYRTREVNIGNCPPHEISTRMEQIMGNFAYQAESGRDPQGLCVEYHFATVQIHPFIKVPPPKGGGLFAAFVSLAVIFHAASGS